MPESQTLAISENLQSAGVCILKEIIQSGLGKVLKKTQLNSIHFASYSKHDYHETLYFQQLYSYHMVVENEKLVALIHFVHLPFIKNLNLNEVLHFGVSDIKGSQISSLLYENKISQLHSHWAWTEVDPKFPENQEYFSVLQHLRNIWVHPYVSFLQLSPKKPMSVAFQNTLFLVGTFQNRSA